MLAIRELVEHAQGEGELGAGPPRELATVLWVLLHGLAQLQITGHLHEPRTIDGDTGLHELLPLALAALHPARVPAEPPAVARHMTSGTGALRSMACDASLMPIR